MASSNYNPDEIATADMDYSFQEMVTAINNCQLAAYCSARLFSTVNDS